MAEPRAAARVLKAFCLFCVPDFPKFPLFLPLWAETRGFFYFFRRLFYAAALGKCASLFLRHERPCSLGRGAPLIIPVVPGVSKAAGLGRFRKKSLTRAVDSIIIKSDNNIIFKKGCGSLAKSFMEAVMNPVRLRVMQFLASHGEGTAGQLRQALGDVPPASLYRHLKVLLESGCIQVARETPARGAV